MQSDERKMKIVCLLVRLIEVRRNYLQGVGGKCKGKLASLPCSFANQAKARILATRNYEYRYIFSVTTNGQSSPGVSTTLQREVQRSQRANRSLRPRKRMEDARHRRGPRLPGWISPWQPGLKEIGFCGLSVEQPAQLPRWAGPCRFLFPRRYDRIDFGHGSRPLLKASRP